MKCDRRDRRGTGMHAARGEDGGATPGHGNRANAGMGTEGDDPYRIGLFLKGLTIGLADVIS